MTSEKNRELDILELEATEEGGRQALEELAREYVEARHNGDLYIAELVVQEMCSVAQRLVDRESPSEREVEYRIEEAKNYVRGYVREKSYVDGYESEELEVLLSNSYPAKSRVGSR